MGTKSASSSLDSLRAHFKVMRECPICTASFHDAHIKVVEHLGNSHVLHVTCEQCVNSLIFLVGSTQMGVGLVGIVSDLSFEDSVLFRGRKPLTDDDLIENYRILQHKHVLHNLLLS